MKKALRMFALWLTLACVLTVTVRGEGGAQKPDTYHAYIKSMDSLPKPIETITLAAGDEKLNTDTIENKPAVLLEKAGDTLSCSFSVNKSGLYHIALLYYPLEGTGGDIELDVTLDGEKPYEGLQKITLTRIFTSPEGDFEKDNRGNELRPSKTEVSGWRKSPLTDSQGISNEPFYFHLEEGEHTVEFKLQREQMAIGEVYIYNDPMPPTYAEYAKTISAAENSIEPIVLEAEHPKHTTSPMLYPISDRSDPQTTPAHPTKIRLNSIGGANWKYNTQSIVWEFDIPTDGYYSIGLRFLQNYKRGLKTARTITIDGKTLFSELNNQTFGYRVNWQSAMLGDEEPYAFYFEQGKHQIEMNVTMGDMAPLINQADDCLYALNVLYRKIIMITGATPDIYRDYYLDTMIPDLKERLQEISASLKEIEASIQGMTGGKASEAAMLNQMYYQIDDFIRLPNTIPTRLETFHTNISALGAWVLSIREQPLSLDKLYIVGYGQPLPEDKGGWFDKILFSIKSFAGSFFEDYSSVGNVYDKEKAISVWIGSGRDQAEVLKSMIDDSFTRETGIPVNFSVVQGALMQAIMANKGPDVALMVGRGQPVNMALREALIPLNDFPDFEKTAQTFGPSDLKPYELKDKVYALPETKNFYMTFYRTDILEELAVKAPDTWDDLYEAAEVLQRNNMNIGLPYANMDAYAVVDQGLGSQSIFPTLLLQSKTRYYHDSLQKTNLSTEAGYKTFKQWVEFYTLYGFPVFKDDYNRFRTGEMPILINNYTFYNMLYTAAPEIRGLWKMAPVPATKGADGSLDRSIVGSGTAAIMIRDAKNKDNAWEFMKWWTSADSQGRFGREIEAILGAAGRYNPATKEAISQIQWSGDELSLITEQLDNVVELEEIPGGYYASRNLDNAFKEVVYGNKNARETLNYWNNKTDEEIVRKRKEFGIE